MNKEIFIISTVILFFGCNTKKEFLNTNLKNISVYEYIKDKDCIYTSGDPMNKICTLTNPDSINVILVALNSKKPDFRIFIPEYEVLLNYADTLIAIGVSQNFIKIKGKPYKINKNLSKYIVCKKMH